MCTRGNTQSMNHISLNRKGRHRCCTKSPTAQDMFWSIPGLIGWAEVTERWEEKALVHWNCDCWLDTTQSSPDPYPRERVGTGLTWVEARSCTCPCPIHVVSNQTFQFCVLSLVFSKTTMDEIRSRKLICLVSLFCTVMQFYNSQCARAHRTGWIRYM